MKYRVTIVDVCLVKATVHAKPSWWDRIVHGRVEADFMVVARPHWRGGLVWLEDSTGREVTDRKLLAAIAAARKAADKAQRDTAQWVRRNGLDGSRPYVS